MNVENDRRTERRKNGAANIDRDREPLAPRDCIHEHNTNEPIVRLPSMRRLLRDARVVCYGTGLNAILPGRAQMERLCKFTR